MITGGGLTNTALAPLLMVFAVLADPKHNIWSLGLLAPSQALQKALIATQPFERGFQNMKQI